MLGIIWIIVMFCLHAACWKSGMEVMGWGCYVAHARTYVCFTSSIFVLVRTLFLDYTHSPHAPLRLLSSPPISASCCALLSMVNGPPC